VGLTHSSKTELGRLLSSNPGISAIARASLEGGVLEVVGEIDAETACAVAAMSARKVAEATSEAGFGRPRAWHVGLGARAFYVVHRKGELLVMSGGANRNPSSTLRALARSCGA